MLKKNLVDTIKEIYAEVDSDSVKAVSTEIDNSIQAIMMDLGNKLTPELSQEVASVYNLNAKFAFYNVCFSKSYDILNKVDPKLASVFSNIQDTNVFVVSKFTEKLLALHPTIAELIQRLEEVENERKTSASNKKNGKSGSVNGSSSDIEELRREIALLREENKIAQDKISRQAREIDRIKKDGGQQVGASNTSKSQVSRKPKFHEDGAVKTAKSSKR